MSEDQEIWKPVVGYEGWYEVSNFGRVRRIAAGIGSVVGRILRNVVIKDGYLGLVLSTDNDRKNFPVHTLVARAFIGERPYRHDINHKDGNKQNPSAQNLEYITSGANQRHAYANKLKKPLIGERHQNAILNVEAVRDILSSHKEFPQSHFARKYGVSGSSISDVIARRTWKHVSLE